MKMLNDRNNVLISVFQEQIDKKKQEIEFLKAEIDMLMYGNDEPLPAFPIEEPKKNVLGEIEGKIEDDKPPGWIKEEDLVPPTPPKALIKEKKGLFGRKKKQKVSATPAPPEKIELVCIVGDCNNSVKERGMCDHCKKIWRV